VVEVTPPYTPADPDDFRFEIVEIEEPEVGCTHIVRVIDDQGEEIEAFTTGDPYGVVEAAREAQAYTLEERLGPYGLEWQREQEQR
jgi:hypothetical protein